MYKEKPFKLETFIFTVEINNFIFKSFNILLKFFNRNKLRKNLVDCNPKDNVVKLGPILCKVSKKLVKLVLFEIYHKKIFNVSNCDWLLNKSPIHSRHLSASCLL